MRIKTTWFGMYNDDKKTHRCKVGILRAFNVVEAVKGA